MAERILVVDDEEDVRNIVARALKGKGYHVKGISLACDALEEIKDRYELAIVDIKLPDASGLELLAQIRRISPLTEVIIITGYATLESAITAIERGAFAYIRKPLQLGELYQTAKSAIEKQKLTAENQRLVAELRKINRRLENLNRTLEKRVEKRTGELRRSQEETEKKARQLAIINEITSAITSSLDLNEILSVVTEETKKIIRFDRASISLTDGSRMINKVYFLEPAGKKEPEEGLTYPLEGTGIEWVIKNRKPLIREDFDGGGEFVEDEYILTTEVKSGMVVPLIYRGEVIGTFNLGSKEKKAYREEHYQILKQIAGEIAIALENAELYRKLKTYSDKLEEKVAERTEALRSNIRELKEAQERLIQSEKLAATSKLIAGVAHEIKNPLNSMSFATANIEKMLNSGFDMRKTQDFCRESLSILRSDIGRLKEMVDRFMVFTRPDRIELEDADINDIIRQVVKGVEGELRQKGITIVEKYAKRIPVLKLEKAAFHRCILNLLLNSRDALERSGRIEIRSGLADNLVTVEVKDNGYGIPPEIRDKIFDIFFTTKAEGAGLGLSQVYRTVESHRGSITFQSEPGKGTTFIITLPTT
ncbi:MAG: response regulator [Candidatus Tritonobacter lacicola]|nr:response regulator [Candidatus Tritonobacter lacicola]